MDGGVVTERVFTAVFLFAGIGVGALGFIDAQVTLNGVKGSVRSLGGVDLDPVACRSFQKLTGSPCHARDLGQMTGAELRGLFGEWAPDFVFMSAPCQGFSGLLSEEKSKSEKYEKLNRLAVQGVELILDAWGKDGPGLILFENVPRIATRGKELLKKIRTPLRAHGYVTHEGTHNCGEIGNLAQSRERFLLVARHSRKVPVFLYQPPKRPLRPCGEVIERLPLPGERAAGRLHQMPAISLRTWLRLAAIRPGKDWRDLSTLDGEARPAWARYAVTPWFEPTGAVAGSGTNSAWGVADVRVPGGAWHDDALGVVGLGESFRAITGRHHPSNGAYSLADVRVDGSWHSGVLGVVAGDAAFGTITGNGRPVCGAFTYADLRVSPRGHAMHWRVLDVDAPAPTVTGTTDIQAGAPSLADLRIASDNPNRHAAKYYVTDSFGPARTITGTDGRVGSGAPCVADVRLRAPANFGCYGVVGFHEPAGTITGNQAPGGSPTSVADLRITCTPWRNSGVLGVLAFTQPSYTVTGALDLWAGWAAVADPRGGDEGAAIDAEVVFEGAAGAGAHARGAARARGHRAPAALYLGPWWSSDPRIPANPRLVVRWRQVDLDHAPPFLPVIPGRGDGSWHRPITLLERAALQGIPAQVNGQPLELEGTLSQVAKHIGNAVPKGAALAIAVEILRTLVLASTGAFMLSSGGGVWVKRRANGTFPLYLDEQLAKVTRRKARKARKAVARIEARTTIGAWTPCEGRA
jgi:site-specific DNA-cytosine methylase